jgi:hypothetical protein
MLVSVLIFTVVFIACAGVAARALVRLGRQLARTGAEFERLSGRMEDRFLPRAEVVLDQTTIVVREMETTAEQARSVGRHFEDALASLGDITVMMEDAVQPIVATAASVRIDRRRVRAIRAGFDAVIGRLFGRPVGRFSEQPVDHSTSRPVRESSDRPADLSVVRPVDPRV